MRRTIGQMIKVVQSLVPATRTSTTSSETVVDTLGFDGVCFLFQTGALTTGGGTPETYACAVLENSSNSTVGATTITGASGSLTAANTFLKIQVKLGGGRKRYMFGRVTMAGSSPSTALAVTALLGPAQYDPQQAVDANV